MQFLTPAAVADSLQDKFSGSETLYPIIFTGEGKEPISAGASDQGVPVALVGEDRGKLFTEIVI